MQGRVAILKVHSKGKSLGKDVDFDKIARRTPGFTGADLQNLMNEAAIMAARRDLREISKDEVADALERIIAGPEKVHSTARFCMRLWHACMKIITQLLLTPSFNPFCRSGVFDNTVAALNTSLACCWVC